MAQVFDCTLMSWQLYSSDDNLICGTSGKALFAYTSMVVLCGKMLSQT